MIQVDKFIFDHLLLKRRFAERLKYLQLETASKWAQLSKTFFLINKCKLLQ